MTCQLAIFDFDGTLADSFDWFLEAYAEVAGDLGLRTVPPEEVPALRHADPRRLMRHLGVSRWRLPQVAGRMRRLMARDIGRIRLFEGIAEMLARLAEGGVTLALVSSNSEANVRRTLGPGNAGLFVEFACGAPLFGKASRLRAVLRRSGVPAARAVAIGDEIRDVDAAGAAGIPFGAVAWGFAAPEALRARGAAMVFKTPSEITQRLLGQGAVAPAVAPPAVLPEPAEVLVSRAR